ncbi:hypothetical protein TI39_contig329g00022 [Zymoseptoria brevis]|uniref:LIM-domain binding protein-domain-containing protein n=1 Tax=Zymoseptoria brevis TaxID=1047168 RepID=A0A0F4GSP5_9PEZI|nr:hypothetical protein TI39_contig329g00022 [Zymoseptoria brevis]
MMAAYQPTPGVHPGLQHGHPGMAPNPGQHMGQPMQMHPGVSGAPHVSQPGAMMGMQPGAGGMGPGGMGGQHPGSGMAMQAQMGGQTMAGGAPNAQAMSHMTPQQMQQQQQQAHIAAQMQANPQFAMQQYQIRQRQAQMMQQHQQQQAANGMMNMQQQGMLSQAQMAQLQQNQQQAMQAGVQLPPHMQQQIQLQQQRLAAQQHAQAQQAQAQQQQQNQMAQQMAMQHANSQQSNPGQPGPPNPQPSQGQPQNPQQGRPPSRIANPNEQAQQSGQPQQHAPQQGQPNQPQPQQNPQPGQPGNPQQQQAQQQQAQQQQAHQQQLSQQQQMQRQQQIQMLQRQQTIRQMQAQAQSQGQQQQAAQGGMFILRLMNFSDHLSNFVTSNGKDIAMWHNFVDRHFAADGRLVHSFDDNSNPGANGRGKIFEVLRPTLPRYFCTYFESGASALRLHTEHAREVLQGNGMHLVTCQNATLSVSYPNGARLDMSGSLHVLFSAGNDTIECFQFATTGTEETLTRAQIEKTLMEHSPTLPIKASPKMTKNKLPKAQQKMQDQQDRLTIDHFPKTPKGTIGITSKVQQFLEIGETMNVMSDLMHYSQEKKMRPDQALEALVAQYDAQSNGQGNPQINLPPNGMRTPSMQHMQMPQNGQQGAFSSPSVSNLNLPMQNGMNGSPHMGNNPGNLGAPNMSMPNHTPSPHQSNMAAPQMMPQHSQQGTNSSVASANTSPNVNNNNNKRRRSTVKLEGDDAGGQDGMGNANRVKPSPRMTKKPKPQG